MRNEELDAICCPVTLEPMKQRIGDATAKAIFTESAKKNGVIVRVTPDPQKPNISSYYYTTQQILSKLKACPITRHTGIFGLIKISDLNKYQQDSLLLSEDLSQVDWSNVSWQQSSFTVIPQARQPLDVLSEERRREIQNIAVNELRLRQHQVAVARRDVLLLRDAIQERNFMQVEIILNTCNVDILSARDALLNLAEHGDGHSWKTIEVCVSHSHERIKQDEALCSALEQHGLRQRNVHSRDFLREHGIWDCRRVREERRQENEKYRQAMRAPVQAGLFLANAAAEAAVAKPREEHNHNTPQCSSSCVMM